MGVPFGFSHQKLKVSPQVCWSQYYFSIPMASHSPHLSKTTVPYFFISLVPQTMWSWKRYTYIPLYGCCSAWLLFWPGSKVSRIEAVCVGLNGFPGNHSVCGIPICGWLYQYSWEEALARRIHCLCLERIRDSLFSMAVHAQYTGSGTYLAPERLHLITVVWSVAQCGSVCSRAVFHTESWFLGWQVNGHEQWESNTSI